MVGGQDIILEIRNAMLRSELNRVDELVKVHGEEILRQEFGDNDTLLHNAAALGLEKTVQYLLAHHVKVSVRDKNNYTPLMLAASAKYLNVVRLLMQYGAEFDSDPHSRDHQVFGRLTGPVLHVIAEERARRKETASSTPGEAPTPHSPSSSSFSSTDSVEGASGHEEVHRAGLVDVLKAPTSYTGLRRRGFFNRNQRAEEQTPLLIPRDPSLKKNSFFQIYPKFKIDRLILRCNFYLLGKFLEAIGKYGFK